MSATEQIDLTDPTLFSDGPPLELLAQLREQAPVQWTDSKTGTGFWSVLRAQDIETVSKDTQLFSSHRGGIFFRPDVAAPLELYRNMLIAKDPPEHTKFRLIGQTAFTPRAVAKLEDDIRGRVTRLIDAFIANGKADLVTEFSIPLPLQVIAHLIGAPQEDIDKLLDWTEQLAETVDAVGFDGTPILLEMGGYLGQLAASVGDGPAEGFGHVLARAEVDGERLNEMELAMFFAIIVFAGNDTTRNATSGGMRALIEHPDQLALLRERPELIDSAIEEILRIAAPLNYFARTATRDTELGGVQIAEGDRLVMWYASGNRDPERFPDPDRFDITREPSAHVVFGGGGRHFCLGAGLARLELKVAIAELVNRLDNLALDGPVVRAGSTWVNGYGSLPISFTAA